MLTVMILPGVQPMDRARLPEEAEAVEEGGAGVAGGPMVTPGPRAGQETDQAPEDRDLYTYGEDSDREHGGGGGERPGYTDHLSAAQKALRKAKLACTMRLPTRRALDLPTSPTSDDAG
jgi:hypothetical protein